MKHSGQRPSPCCWGWRWSPDVRRRPATRRPAALPRCSRPWPRALAPLHVRRRSSSSTPSPLPTVSSMSPTARLPTPMRCRSRSANRPTSRGTSMVRSARTTPTTSRWRLPLGGRSALRPSTGLVRHASSSTPPSTRKQRTIRAAPTGCWSRQRGFLPDSNLGAAMTNDLPGTRIPAP